MNTTYHHYYPSPVGRLLLLAQQQGLTYLEFEQEQLANSLTFPSSEKASAEIQAIFCKTIAILDHYFQGVTIDFSRLDFLTPQGTSFQQQVWQALRQIPYGETTSYGELATQLGKPNAMRAVGGAVGRNPISILIPCHRVLGKNRTLTGFGGGLPNKRYLLNLEQIAYTDQGIEFVKPKRKKWY